MEESSGPAIGQTVSVKAFDQAGKRVQLSGKVCALEAQAMVLQLEANDTAFALPSGERVMVEYTDERGHARFSSHILSVKLAQQLKITLELPNHITRLMNRRFVRHVLRLPVVCSRLDRDGTRRERYQAHTMELGAKGACLITDRPIEVGATLAFEIDLRKSGSCSGVAEVRHTSRLSDADESEFQWGVEFTQMDGVNLERLQEFLRQAAQRKAGGR